MQSLQALSQPVGYYCLKENLQKKTNFHPNQKQPELEPIYVERSTSDISSSSAANGHLR
jgi:hypothetical protein